MKLKLSHSAFKTKRVEIQTASWLAGPKLLVNGVVAKKHKGTYMVASDSGAYLPVKLKYNFIDPVPKVTVSEESVELVPPLKWYEYAWVGIPLLLLFAGGAIGGFFGALGTISSGHVFRSDRSAVAKYSISALITIGVLIAYVVVAILIRLLIGV